MSFQQSIASSLFERYTSTAIGFISSIIIARLLTPEEIGVFSVSAAVLTLAHVIREFGVGNYLIQEKTLTKRIVSSVLGISIILSWSAGILLFFGSYYVSAFYGDDRLREVLWVLSANFIFIPFSSAIYPLLRREMKFKKLYKINVSVNLTYAVVAVVLAYYGFSYMSLAWASLAGVLVTFFLAQLYRPDIAKVSPTLAGWQRIIAFGRLNTVANLVAALGVESPDLIIGKKAGFHMVGIYSRAYGMVTMLWSISIAGLIPVYHSELARLNRLGEDLNPVYLKGVNYITAIAWPMYGYVAMFSEDIIVMLYGYQWKESGLIASILCISLMVDALFSLNGSALLALGKIKQHMVCNVVGNVTKFVLVLVAISYSLYFVAWSIVLASFVFGVTSFNFVSDNISVNWVNLGKVALGNALLMILSLLPTYLLFVRNQMFENSFYVIAGSGACLMASWLLAVYILRHGITIELNKLAQRFRVTISTF
ncbi:MAG: lipopolysaccharide biosynthesis protein [Alcanivoracaceae bacterium]|nr:lipopolysaccharide biosynthesis protein [Alcanivoracaceae bacterium]